MIKKILMISLIILSVFPALAEEDEVESEQVSGLVRVVRSNPETEIFFIDRKESVIVPGFHPDHNKAVKMSLDSIKNKKPISFSVNPVSRRLISAGAKKTTSAPAPEQSTDSVKPAAPTFKEIPGDTAQ